MAYKQKGCTPITAKLQKTTKGGMVQQPLLNMGAPVKMKSPAKQDKKYITPYREKVALEKERNNYEKELKQNKLDKSKSLDEYRFAATRKAVDKRMKNFESKYGDRVKGEEGFAADDLARKNKTGKYAVKVDTPKVDTPEKNLPKKDLPKTNKVTGKIGSDLRRQQYDKLGWKYDSTINAPKENKKEQSIKPKAEPKAEAKVVSMETKSETGVPNKPVEVGNAKKSEKKIAIAENKERRAAKVRAKGEKALASGNKEKALKLKRREEAINKRAAKKRSQASQAINPS